MSAEPVVTPFTGDAEADRLLTDDGLALLIGMLLDQQVPMEWAFRGPYELRRRLGGSLGAAAVAAMPADAVRALFTEKPSLHRYPGSMAERVQQLCRHVAEEYDGDAARIWTTAADAQELYARVKALPGYGDQKARIFVAILGKRLGVAPAGWEQVAGDYGRPGHRSIADVDGPGAIEKVRAYKQAQKQAAKQARQPRTQAKAP